MPYSDAEKKTMRNFRDEYGPKGEEYYWRSVNSGKVHGRGIKKPGRHGRHRKRRRKTRSRSQ